ncbi:hypothetical protein TNCV_3294941 [Trichonephila clavipes]|uniref:Uncharacterized protein n=1 Tax=Trichonephila clavipes TaxID=2585209 RepID=A0A8X6T1C1_TRICX|nr:hypothetical protein TNCV_3294941 [Trichonephila clavipes]
MSVVIRAKIGDSRQQGQKTATTTQLSRELYAANGTRVLQPTVAQRHHEKGLRSRRSVASVRSLQYTFSRAQKTYALDHTSKKHRDFYKRLEPG